jgi:hypothetical protein
LSYDGQKAKSKKNEEKSISVNQLSPFKGVNSSEICLLILIFSCLTEFSFGVILCKSVFRICIANNCTLENAILAGNQNGLTNVVFREGNKEDLILLGVTFED